MIVAAVAVLLAVTTLQAQNPPQAFRLESGDYRYLEITVNHVPTEVDCRFEVLQGRPVNVELLPSRDVPLFDRGRDHRSLAVYLNARAGTFRRIIDHRGQYALVVKNPAGSPPAVVSLELSTNLNPNSTVSGQELPARKRLTVILISFALFFAIVMWSGLRLMRALKRE